MAKNMNQTSQTQQTTGLKIIGAGFGRTGTLSLKTALEELGFGPCHHMTEVFGNPWQVSYWQAATNGEPVDWHTVLSGYRSTTDWPSCAFYDQLMQAYPDAKVILSVRDPEKWYESVSHTIYRVSQISQSRVIPLIALMNPLVRSRMRVARMINALVWQRTFHGKFADKQYAIDLFNQHNEEVKQRVPADKLLVFDVKQGWEPLCAFLGVEVPNKPFPRLNERENFVGAVRRQQERVRTMLTFAGIGIAAAVALFVLLRRLTK